MDLGFWTKASGVEKSGGVFNDDATNPVGIEFGGEALSHRMDRLGDPGLFDKALSDPKAFGVVVKDKDDAKSLA